MSESRETGIAEDALRWHFGTGSSTAAGDMGLRSPFGYALDRARDEQLRSGQRYRRSKNEVRSMDIDSTERDIAKLIQFAARDRCIIAALGEMAPHDVEVLRLHFADKPIHPGVSAVVKVTREARQEAQRQYGKPTTAQIDQCVLEAAWPKEPWLKLAVRSAQAKIDKAVAAFAVLYREKCDAKWGGKRRSLMRWEQYGSN